jgi:N-acetylmuramoyl-L-alanine amidase
MIFYKEGSEESRRLADLVYGRLSQSHPAGSRKPRVGSFYVVRNSRTPAVLVEVGFMSNEQDRTLLTTAEHRRALAEALAGALAEYHGETRRASR